MLSVDSLVATYGPVRAVDGVSLTARPGEITAVLGANGAGKTTLLRAVSGLVPVQHGEVTFEDRRVTGLSPERVVRRGIAHVPEGRGVIAELTVEENLRLGGLWRRDKADMRRRIAQSYELFPPLRDRAQRPTATLSGGERQMLAIARALVSAPRLLLLDEPSLGLAPRITAQIMTLLRTIATETQLAVLLVEQNARSALSVAHRAVVLNLGRVVADDAPATLAADERLRHAYLGF